MFFSISNFSFSIFCTPTVIVVARLSLNRKLHMHVDCGIDLKFFKQFSNPLFRVSVVNVEIHVTIHRTKLINITATVNTRAAVA